MITFAILAVILLTVLVLGVLLLGIGGGLFTVLFGDLIVCGIFIGLIMRLIIKRKKKK